MSAIENDIKECGKAIDTYRKQRLFGQYIFTSSKYYELNNCSVKFIKAPMWEGKLVGIGKGLGDRKTEIMFSLSIHTSVGVDKINAQAVEMQAKLDRVLEYVVETKSPREIEWEKEMDKLGGREACMADPKKMAQISAIFMSKEDRPAESELGRRGQANDEDEEKRLLLATAEELIDENAELYERKITQQTEQIKDAIANSTSIILTSLNSGPPQ
jgi:hypothetical protein